MNLTKKLGLKVFGLVIVALLLAVNCAEEGTAPDANLPPNTFITNYQIEIAPDSATAYNAKISWSGNDVDGAIYWYEWCIINPVTAESLYWYEEDDDGNIDTTNISDWVATNVQAVDILLDYPTFDTRYVFKVRAQDNDLAIDATPAVDTISIDRIRDFNYAPDTDIITGPTNGALCGQGIYFLISGSDIDGVVDTIAYSVDGGSWLNIPTDITTGTREFNLTGLSNGAHTIAFKSIDNFRKEDPSPISVSVTVADTLAPELAISVPENFSYVVPYTAPQLEELAVTITATVDFYYSAIDSFVVTNSAGLDTTITEDEITFTEVDSGSYWINVTAYDIAGNSTSTGNVSFSVNVLFADNGVLCVNGVDWGTYGTDNAAQWNAGTPWGSRTNYKIWDVFDSTPLSSLNSDFTDNYLGYGSVPTWMLDTLYFEAISWFGNNYSGDLDYWEEVEEELMAYLEMGGNIYLPSRRAHYFFNDELTEYCHISSWAEDATADTILVAAYTGLPDILAIGSQSYTSIPTLSSSSEVTTLYTDAGYPGASAGFIVQPNGETGGGQFCFIAGRNYRWDHTQLKTATEFVLTQFFGME